MGKRTWMALALSLALLAGCGYRTMPAQGEEPAPGGASSAVETAPGGGDRHARPDPGGRRARRLPGGGRRRGGRPDPGGEEAGEVYTLDVSALGLEEPLADGMMVEILYDGMILETWPAQFANVLAVRPAEGAAADDRCGLCLQVLADLWEVDAGLNEDITQLGVDLSGFTGLTEGGEGGRGLRLRHGARHPAGHGHLGGVGRTGLYRQGKPLLGGRVPLLHHRRDRKVRRAKVAFGPGGLFLPGLHRLHGTGRDLDLHGRRRGHRLSRISRREAVCPQTVDRRPLYFILGNRKGEGALRVEVHIDPDCREPRVTITAPVLTDEIRDLAARLEGRRRAHRLAGRDRRASAEEAILRCFAQDKG